jgi:hypothetical protein
MGWVVKAIPPASVAPEKTSVFVVVEANWVQVPVWTSVKKLPFVIGVWTPDRQACNKVFQTQDILKQMLHNFQDLTRCEKIRLV